MRSVKKRPPRRVDAGVASGNSIQCMPPLFARALAIREVQRLLALRGTTRSHRPSVGWALMHALVKMPADLRFAAAQWAVEQLPRSQKRAAIYKRSVRSATSNERILSRRKERAA